MLTAVRGQIGSDAKRQIANVHLSRYACALIVQNGVPAKPVIANGQTYFALLTRRQELHDDDAFARLSENEKSTDEMDEIIEKVMKLARHWMTGWRKWPAPSKMGAKRFATRSVSSHRAERWASKCIPTAACWSARQRAVRRH